MKTFIPILTVASVLALAFFGAASLRAQSGQGPASLLPDPTRNAAAKESTVQTSTSSTTPYGYTQNKFRVPAFADLPWDRPLPLSDNSGLKYAVLAGGCFWCLEAVYELVPGVIDVVSGYIDGKGSRPSYQAVGTGVTGYAEAVRIAYDPAVVSYETLLDYFWKIHDPTTLNRQGYDVGTQYRSGIYYADEAQKKAAVASIFAAQKQFRDKIVTSMKAAGDFWIAEGYHQDYYRLNPDAGYCQAVVAPKVKKAGF